MAETGRREDDFGWTWEENRRRQALVGLSMTPAERLRWLEETMEFLRSICGLARIARRDGD